MITYPRRLIAILLALALPLGSVPGARAAVSPPETQAGAIGRTPPRVSYTDGEVSFWRPGAGDWAPALVNTPLAPGDELYTGHQGDLELQVGTRAFVRAWGDTTIGLANQEPDFLQLKLTSGHVSLDLRSVDPGHSVELNTPHAAFTLDQPGYYRADVTPTQTSFITRRGGRATMTPAGSQSVAITSSEEVVLEGTPAPTVQSYVAPELDVWDQWNYARTDHLLEAVSARYVSSAVYGVDDLDHYGNWRVVAPYGPVWVPESVAPEWVPYSTGHWISDPYYGWTWVDSAPWGWAPYHYGRWVFVSGVWAWAPGPVVVRPTYTPALVAFFGTAGASVSIAAPVMSWVALSWGEPVVPWWGPARFIGRPSWAGWGGEHVVNNVTVNRTTVVNVNTVTVYKNVSVQNAVVAVRQDHFGRRPVEEARITQVDVHRLEPVHGALRATPEASSFVPASGRAVRPPEATLSRRVVATRPPAGHTAMPPGEAPRTPVASAPSPHIVAAPKTTPMASAPPRPRFGTSPVERERPPLPPRFATQHPEAAPAEPRASAQRPEAMPSVPREREQRSQPMPPVEHRGSVQPVPHPATPSRPAAATPEPPRVSARALPGEPANRLSPGRVGTELRRPESGPGGRPHSQSGSAPVHERDRR